MVEMAKWGAAVSVQRQMDHTIQWLSFLRNVGGGEELYIFLEGCFMPDPSFSSSYVVLDFPSMFFSYLFTTSLPLPVLFPCLYLAVRYILLVVPVFSGEFSAHSYNSHCLSCLEVTRGLGENSMNFWCNMGATQPIGIFLPQPSRKSTQLCGFDIFNSFCHCPCNGSPLILPSWPPSFPALFGCIVCRQLMCWVKIQGKSCIWPSSGAMQFFQNQWKSPGFFSGYPSFLRQSLLSHWPLPCYHPLIQLSDYQLFLFFPLILPLHH